MSMFRVSRLLIVAVLLGGCSSSSDDLVRPPVIAFIGVSPSALVLTIGQTRQMTAIVRDASGNLLVDRAVRWSVDEATVAAISATGQLTAVGQGYVTITATSEGKSSSVAATIVQPELSKQTQTEQRTRSGADVGRTHAETAKTKTSKVDLIKLNP